MSSESNKGVVLSRFILRVGIVVVGSVVRISISSSLVHLWATILGLVRSGLVVPFSVLSGVVGRVRHASISIGERGVLSMGRLSVVVGWSSVSIIVISNDIWLRNASGIWMMIPL